MPRLAILAAACALTILAAPASAQQVISNPGYCAQFYPNANCNNRGPNNPYTGDYQRNGGTAGPLAGNNGEGYNANADTGERRSRRSYNR